MAIKPLLSHLVTGEFNSPPKYLRTTTRCAPLRTSTTRTALSLRGSGGGQEGVRRGSGGDLSIKSRRP
eukprot:721912-Prorocentrum_minimum.AAC.1